MEKQWESAAGVSPGSLTVQQQAKLRAGCVDRRRPPDKICWPAASNNAADCGRQRRLPVAHILPIVIVVKDPASLDASGDAMLQYAGCFRKGASRHGCRLTHLGPVVSSLDSLTSLSIAPAEHMALRQVWKA